MANNARAFQELAADRNAMTALQSDSQFFSAIGKNAAAFGSMATNASKLNPQLIAAIGRNASAFQNLANNANQLSSAGHSLQSLDAHSLVASATSAGLMNAGVSQAVLANPQAFAAISANPAAFAGISQNAAALATLAANQKAFEALSSQPNLAAHRQLQHRQEEVLLTREVGIQRAHRIAGVLGDLVDGGGMVAAPREDVGSRLQKLQPGLGFLLVPGQPRGDRPRS